MGDLNDDLILEVLSWLPLREVVRCKILNKNFYECISSRKFEHKHFVRTNQKNSNSVYLSESHDPRSLYQLLQLDSDCLVKHKLDDDSICQSNGRRVYGFRILASNGGIVFLHLSDINIYCLFNPVTGEFQRVPWVGERDGPIGLAVDNSCDSGMYRYKLVAVQGPRCVKEQVLFKFKTLSVGSTKWESDQLEEEDLFRKPSRGCYIRWNSRPVYLHGSLHWLLDGGNILAFDVEKNDGRVFEGPVVRTSQQSVWLGGVHDSLVYVHAYKSKIYIYAYNDHDLSSTTTWEIRHKINNVSCKGNSIPILYDGERLYSFVMHMGVEDEIYVHDFFTKSKSVWSRMTSQTRNNSNCFYLPFVATLAKLYSGLYLHKPPVSSETCSYCWMPHRSYCTCVFGKIRDSVQQFHHLLITFSSV